MNIFRKKFTAITMSIVFIFIALFGHVNSIGIAHADGMSSVALSSKEIVRKTPVYIIASQEIKLDQSSYIVYSNEKDEEVLFDSYYNVDTDYYNIEILLESSGLWKVKETNIVGINNYDDYSIQVYDDLESMTGNNNGYIDFTSLDENSEISGNDFESIFSQIKGYDSNGNNEEVEITLSRDNNKYILYSYFDGLSSSIRFAENLYLAPGNYNVELSLSNHKININFILTSMYSNIDELEEDFQDLSVVPAKAMSSVSNITTVNRLYGNDRYLTAVAISKSNFNSSNNVILVNGKSTNEILAASNLAKVHKAPILLTDSATINPNTSNEIKRLNSRNIIIIGDTSQVSLNIENNLKTQGYIVSRMDGQNIYSTATIVAKAVKLLDNKDAVILSSASSQADSLSAAAVSASYSYPILFTGKDSIPTETINYLKNSNIKRIIIVGGSSTISGNVENNLKNQGFDVSRYSGTDRYETSIRIAERYFPKATLGNIATGTVFVDSLAGAPVAGSKDSPVLLVTGDTVSKDLNNYLIKTGLKNANIFGGTASVSAKFKSNLENTLSSIHSASSGQSGEVIKPNNSTKIKILLDPGHGAGATHNRGYVGAKWKNEGDGNYYFSLLLKKELESYGIEVGTTRSAISNDPSLDSRGAKGAGYDLLLSLHTNAANGTAKGVEIYNDVTRSSGSALAGKLNSTISSTLNTTNRGVKQRYYSSESQENYYGVLRANKAKAGMLIEHCFHDNMDDVTTYENNAEILAKNMAKTIAQYYGIN